jgi:hypothetical protein
MDLEQARVDLAHALEVGAPAGERFRAARRLLISRGAEALQIDPAALPGLGVVLGRAARAPATLNRRAFAVLVVHALAVDGLLSVGSSQVRLDRDICAFLESALPDVLRRSGYPFAGDIDAKRRSLGRLHGSIDEWLAPLEPTFPGWLSGLPPS